MKISTFFIIILSATLVFTVYELSVFQKIRQIDQHFEINTRFNEGDIIQWLAPTRKIKLVSRWQESLTTNIQPRALNALALKDCLVAENPCVDMLNGLAPQVPFWKTAEDLRQNKVMACKELSKQLRQGKLISRRGRTIRNSTTLMRELQKEAAILQEYVQDIKKYRHSCALYNIVSYTPLYLFTALHYSKTINAFPQWIKGILNHLVSRYIHSRYESIKTETTKLAQKQSPWYYRWRVQNYVDETFEALKSRAEKHSFIHDYSPYYHKLRYDFDLEVKNVYHELERLLERNSVLQEFAKTAGTC